MYIQNTEKKMNYDKTGYMPKDVNCIYTVHKKIWLLTTYAKNNINSDLFKSIKALNISVVSFVHSEVRLIG